MDANEWDIEAAVTEFFAEQDEALQDANAGGGRRLGSDEPAPQPSGGRTLGGAPAPASASAPRQSTQARRPQQKKFATLGDLQASSGAGESTDDEDENQDFFAGGEKSGLAVQNPDDIKQKILEKAMR